jgi:glycerophosphoryl diester phosphodiesterase
MSRVARGQGRARAGVPRPWPYPRVLAHRGGGLAAPENTLAALRTGHAHGLKGVEFDVMLAGDQVPVLMHDDVFGRTVPGSGPVAGHGAAELAAMDAGAWHPSGRFAGEPVPTYEQAVRLCQELGLWMNVEIKPAPGQERLTGTVVARETQRLLAAAQPPAGPLPLLSSFSFDALEAARAAAPGIPRGMLFKVIPANWRAVLAALDCVSLHVDHRMLTPYLVREVHDAGYWVFAYTPNGARVQTLLSWGTDGVCTDRLDQLQPI